MRLTQCWEINFQGLLSAQGRLSNDDFILVVQFWGRQSQPKARGHNEFSVHPFTTTMAWKLLLLRPNKMSFPLHPTVGCGLQLILKWNTTPLWKQKRSIPWICSLASDILNNSDHVMVWITGFICSLSIQKCPNASCTAVAFGVISTDWI